MKAWVRVHGPNLDVRAEEKMLQNKRVFESDKFKNACEKAGIPATKRQASKFSNGKGAAYAVARVKKNQ